MSVNVICLTVIPAHQPEHPVYGDEVNGMNIVNDQEVPTEDHAYEEVSNHVSGEDVVDLQNGQPEIVQQQMQTEVSINSVQWST